MHIIILISDYLSFGIKYCLYFVDLNHFTGQGRHPGNNFVAFLENLRHQKFILRLSNLCTMSVFIKFGQNDKKKPRYIPLQKSASTLLISQENLISGQRLEAAAPHMAPAIPLPVPATASLSCIIRQEAAAGICGLRKYQVLRIFFMAT